MLPRREIDPRGLIALLVALAAALAFLPSLFNDFAVYWDDSQNLTTNPAFRGLGLAQLKWMFTTFYGGPYQPLTWLSFGLDYELWGLDPLGYHLTNLLLHATNAALFYLVSERLLSLAFRKRPDGSLRAAAALSALLFAVHPLRVEAVAFATERRTVLAAAFYLGAVLEYLRPKRRLPLVAVLFALSLLSKGVGIALPATLLALDFYPLRRPLAREALLEKAPLLLVALAFGVAEVVGYRSQAHLLSLRSVGLASRLAQAGFGLGFYVCKTLVPLGLSPVYRMPRTAVVVLSGLLALELTAVLVWLRRATPAALAAWVHYLATLLPVIGILQVSSQMAGDRYTYLPCLGFPPLAAAAALTLGRRRFGAALCAGLAIAAALGALSWRQTRYWRDSITLWKRAVEVDPRNLDAVNNLGVALEAVGKRDEAVELYKRAAELEPHAIYPPLNLGAAYLNLGRLDESIEQYERALFLDPENAQARHNLGVALIRKGRQREGDYQLWVAAQLKSRR